MIRTLEELEEQIMACKLPDAHLAKFATDLMAKSALGNSNGWSIADVLLHLRRRKETWRQHAELAVNLQERQRWLGACRTLSVLISSIEEQRLLAARRLDADSIQSQTAQARPEDSPTCSVA